MARSSSYGLVKSTGGGRGNSLRVVFFVKHCEMDEVPGFRMRGDWRCEALAGEECGAELEQRRLIRSAGSVGDVACC